MPERTTRAACIEPDLARSEAMLRRAERAAGIGCWELDLSTGLMVGSEGALEVIGLDRCEDLLAQVQDAAIPEHRALFRQALDDLIAGIAPYDIEFRIRRPRDGRLADLHATAEYDRASKTVFGVVEDVTVRKAAEAELVESEGRYRSLFQENTSAMLLIDQEDGRIVDANAAAAAFYGWNRRKLRSMRIHEINTLDKDEIEASMRAAAESKRNRYEFRHRTADGGLRDVEVYTGPISVGGKSLLYSIVHDITEAKRAKAEIEKLLAEKELLLKEVHHRIKNNMVAIDGLLALREQTIPDEAARSALEDARSKVLGMMAIYDRLYRSSDFRSVNAREYFESLMREIESNFGRGRPVAFETRVEDMTLDARVLVPLAIIVNELVINSLKHAFPGGRKGAVTLSAARSEDGTVTVVVGDDGVGMGRPRGAAGSGFGRALVASLAKQLGAAMEFGPGAGTSLRLTFKP
jgi:two-component system, sensor histidine kinase PdtaS